MTTQQDNQETAASSRIGTLQAMACRGISTCLLLAMLLFSNNSRAVDLPPIILQLPTALNILPGLTATLSVLALGNNLHYQWTRNGYPIPGATNPLLTLLNVGTESAGGYQVTVFNDGGAVKTPVANVLLLLIPQLPVADNFASRGTIRTASGLGTANSSGATVESGEPLPFPGVNSTVWMTWVAPSSGVATFSTVGSAFDTVIGVYSGTTLTNLTQITADDDSGGFATSVASFNAQAGTAYQISVGSRDTNGGPILLNWMLDTAELPLPTITSSPTNITAETGDFATLSVEFQSSVPVTVQWYHDGQAIGGATQNSLQLSGLTVADLGSYQVELSSADWTLPLPPVEVQFNSEGLTTVGARSKLFDAIDSALITN